MSGQVSQGLSEATKPRVGYFREGKEVESSLPHQQAQWRGAAAGCSGTGCTGAGLVGAFASIPALYSSFEISFTSEDRNVTMLCVFASLNLTASPLRPTSVV